MLKIGLQIFNYILYLSVIASILAIIVLFFRKTFDKKISPTWKLGMWLLVLISLCIPFRFTIQSKNTHTFFVSNLVDKIEIVIKNLMLGQYGKILMYIWLGGMGVLLLYYFISSIIMKQKIGNEVVKDIRLTKILEQAKKQMGVKKEIQLIKQKDKKVPCIYGIIKPRILITEEILKEEEETLYYIFLHELAHYKRKDIVLNKLLIIITTIYWFNPIIWFCFKQIRQDMELKADEMVLARIQKKEEKKYAKTLVMLLPISQEEKQTAKVLSVTDGKKNMERRIKMIKLSEKFKEYKMLIGVTTLLLTLCIGIIIFTQIKPKEENLNYVQYFETPDRIIYKEKGADNYYVFTSAKQEYTNIMNQLIHGIDGIGEGERLSEETIRKIQEEENYIELDYDTISKNYIICYEKENYNVIKRTDEGGQVVKQTIKNKENLQEELKKATKKTTAYHMKENELYKFEEPIEYEVPSWSNELKKYEQGTYTVRLGNMNALANFLSNNNLKYDGNITEETFEKSNVIASITKYKVLGIDTRIGGMTYHFYGTENSKKYYITLFTVSKAVNINCIYRDYENVTPLGF